MERRPIVVDLMAAQRLGCEKLGKCLWLLEELSVAEISRRLLLEHPLWAESERGMVEVGAGVDLEHCPRTTTAISLYGYCFVAPQRRS